MSCEAAKEEFGETNTMQAAPFLLPPLLLGKLRGEGEAATITTLSTAPSAQPPPVLLPIYSTF